jgi:hypothetical protein
VPHDFNAAQRSHVFEQTPEVVLGVGCRYPFRHLAILAKNILGLQPGRRWRVSGRSMKQKQRWRRHGTLAAIARVDAQSTRSSRSSMSSAAQP